MELGGAELSLSGPRSEIIMPTVTPSSRMLFLRDPTNQWGGTFPPQGPDTLGVHKTG